MFGQVVDHVLRVEGDGQDARVGPSPVVKREDGVQRAGPLRLDAQAAEIGPAPEILRRGVDKAVFSHDPPEQRAGGQDDQRLVAAGVSASGCGLPKARVHKFQGHARLEDHPISTPSTKIGGSPIGFSGIWPTCGACNHSMQFVLQLDLRHPVTVCGKFAWAYLFICPHYENYQAAPRGEPCPTWDPFAGANALILQASSSSTVAAAPGGVTPFPERAVDFLPYEAEDEGEDGTGLINPKFMELLEEAEANTPADAENVEVELPEHWMAPKTVQLGGDPNWLQSPQRPKCPVCRGRMKLLAQLDAEVAEASFDEQKYYLPFGSAGWGYAFACDKECDPAGAAFLWQTS